MRKNFYRFLSLIAALTLALGNFYNASASPLSATAAKTYIVDKNNIGGNGCGDAWAGTVAKPLCSISKGISLLKPGDTLLVRKGQYPSFTVKISGKQGAYITISGYQNEMPLIKGGAGIYLKGTSYIRIRRFEVVGAVGNWNGGITVTNSSTSYPMYNIIEKNKVHHNTYPNMVGIEIEEGSHNKVLRNQVFNNYFSGIRVVGKSYGAKGNEIGFNRVYNNTLAGGDADGIGLSGKLVSGTYIHNNVVYGNADDGIDTWDSSNNTIVGNVSYGQKGVGDGNGFKLGGSSTGGGNLVKNNVSYNNKENGFLSNGSGGNKYYNNVAYGNGNYGFQDVERNNSSCTLSTCAGTFINNIGYNNGKGNFAAGKFTTTSHNNIWYSNSGEPRVSLDYKFYPSLSEFYAATGNKLDNPNNGDLSSYQVNPQFTNPSLAKFALKLTSPAIDRGDPANPGKVKAVNRVDIGAFEVKQAATATTLDSLDDALVYSAGWAMTPSSRAYNGTYRVTTKNGASVRLTFTGKSFSVLYTSGPKNRQIKVFIDGKWVGTISQRTSVIRFQKRWDYPGQLAAGTHTLKLVFVTPSLNTRGTVDAVIVR